MDKPKRIILPIKKQWFDMILSGEKKEEYREIKNYYTSRLGNYFGISAITFFKVLNKVNRGFDFNIEVLFRNGYSATSPSFIAECKLKIDKGRPEWGAELNKNYFVFEIVEIKEVAYERH